EGPAGSAGSGTTGDSSVPVDHAGRSEDCAQGSSPEADAVETEEGATEPGSDACGPVTGCGLSPSESSWCSRSPAASDCQNRSWSTGSRSASRGPTTESSCSRVTACGPPEAPGPLGPPDPPVPPEPPAPPGAP